MRAGRRRRSSAGALGVLGLLALGGCQSAVETAVTVTGPAQANVHVSAAFTDEAAKAITADPALQEQLKAVFADRSGSAPAYRSDDSGVHVDGDLTYEQLKASAGVLGVSSLALGGSGSDVSLQMTLNPPTDLAQAVVKAAAGHPDSGPLAATMLKSTTVSVSVTFAGGIHQVSGVPSRVDGGFWQGGTAVFARNADDERSQVVAVTGDPSPSRMPWVAGGGGAVALVALVAARRRR